MISAAALGIICGGARCKLYVKTDSGLKEAMQ